jgi:hypothetical protein
MTQDIESLLAYDEAMIRDDGFTGAIERRIRAEQARRRMVLSAFGMTGLGLAAGGLWELAMRMGPRLPSPAAPVLDSGFATSLMGQVAALPPVELAVMAGAALAVAGWVWQLAIPSR